MTAGAPLFLLAGVFALGVAGGRASLPIMVAAPAWSRAFAGGAVAP
jgi:hypothetical protein